MDDRLAVRSAFRAHYWTAEEVDRPFAAAGFRITRRWGGYGRTRRYACRSQRLLVEAVPAA